jgi:hypothetical protein
MSTDIVTKLDELAELQAAQDVTRLDYDAKRKSILAQVQDQLDALDAEYQSLLGVAGERIGNLESEVRALVLANGASVKGTKLHAVYTKGRVTWDTKGLDGYAAAHPELATFRKEGTPSVTIRAAK